ncbi:hypothetical protein AADZ84_04405 [Colwelliaceae bacterium MEBiC 14330]
MDFPLVDFILASLLMGLGIGLDVAIATVARAGQLQTFKTAALWVAGVSLTHTLFPMFGYLLTHLSVQVNPQITPLIGIIAFVCIFVYLKAELSELAQPTTEQNHSQILITLGLILAVSWDALWSGPAKSAQVIGWPELLVWGSFIFVGAMVSTLAIMSLKLSRLFIRVAEKNHHLSWLSSWVQYGVIGYFGLLALFRYTLAINLFWWQILLLSFITIGGLMYLCLNHNRAALSLNN